MVFVTWTQVWSWQNTYNSMFLWEGFQGNGSLSHIWNNTIKEKEMKRVKKKKGTGKNAHHYYTKEVRLALCKNILLLQVDLLVQMVCRWSPDGICVCSRTDLLESTCTRFIISLFVCLCMFHKAELWKNDTWLKGFRREHWSDLEKLLNHSINKIKCK